MVIVRVIVIVLLALVTSTCSGKRTVEPHPEKWAVYAAGWEFKQIYVLDADSLNVIDSIPFEGSPVFMSTNPTGAYLYIWSDGLGTMPAGTYIIDAKTKQVVHASEEPLGLPRFAKGGQYLILLRSYENQRIRRSYLSDPLTLSIVDSLPDSLQFQDAQDDGDTVLVEIRGTSTLALFDLSSGNLSGRYSTLPDTAESSSRAVIEYAKLVRGSNSVVVVTEASVEVGDMSSGETHLTFGSRGFGQVDVSRDGAYAIVSIPILDGWTEARPTKLYLIDLRTSTLTLSMEGFSSENDLECGGLCAFLPDGHRALVGALDVLNYGPLQLFEVDAGTITRWIELPTEDDDVRCFAVGRVP